ncbi:hypothetical protein EJ08DRAFT_647693 [Tothia fuscella]|uniref:Uncharacterized protein n=1 Tax=Tothia fuscella TaxID=1048955 RepID=A0A9P4U1F2_9PEZI|nr:hypothetical protein EJ08DRAFT_647693 [Tothia fuscella]
MLSITPKHTPKRLFPTPAIAKAKAQQPHTAPVQEATVVIKPTTPTEPNLLSRVWSYLPFSYKPPPRPTHALLDDLPLLPKYEPWTRSHYLTLDRLYYRYLRNPSLFSPSHPSNKNILTPGFIPYIDIDIYNYGYEARLSTSHIILASLFSSLLVLNSFEEFKLANGGEDIDDSEKLLEPCKEGTKINEWIVVRRLFSLVGSKWVERDEERGLDPLGEREGDMRWRFAGQTEWIEWVGMEVHGEWDGRVV